MNRTVFNKNLGILTKVDQQVLDRIGGSLRKAGMVSVGGRGPNAPVLTPEDAKNIILGLLGSDNASRAAEAVKERTGMKSATGKSFDDEIIKIFSGAPDYVNLANIWVSRTHPEAGIVYGYEGDPESQEEEIYRPKNASNDQDRFFYVRATLDGNALKTIGKICRFVEKQLS